MDDETEEGTLVNLADFRNAKDDPRLPTREEPTNSFPVNDYIVTDIDNVDWYQSGFLIFTPHHISIMKPTEAGAAVPGLVLPIGRVKAAFIDEEVDD
jgi:hypothetical protein